MKPTRKSGDDMTAKCQALSRSLVQLEEGDIFGDSDEDEPYFQARPESNPESNDEYEEEIRTPSAATDNSSKHGMSMLSGSSEIWWEAALDTKSKNSKPNPTTRLNVVKGKYWIILQIVMLINI